LPAANPLQQTAEWGEGRSYPADPVTVPERDLAMLKKMLLVGAIVGAGFATLKGTKVFSHAKSEFSSLTEWVESKIPPEKEIARLRKEVSALDKDIKNVGALLAKETVEVKYMKEDADKLRSQVATEKERLQVRADTLSDATEKVKLGGRMVSPAEAKEALLADVQRAVGRKNSLAAMETSIAAKERVRESLERQLDELKKKKVEMAAEIDTVEAQFQMLKVQQMESKYQFDGTRLAGIKASLLELRKKHDMTVEELKLAPVVRSEEGGNAETMSIDEIMQKLNGPETPAPKADGKVSKK
jgi:peptidoglycan hydrolase CwlO-like protein